MLKERPICRKWSGESRRPCGGWQDERVDVLVTGGYDVRCLVMLIPGHCQWDEAVTDCGLNEQ